MQRVGATGGEAGVDIDEVADAADLGGEDDLSLRKPWCSAAFAESSALTTMASIMTSRAGSGADRRLFSSIIFVSSDWSSEPQLTPMRTGF